MPELILRHHDAPGARAIVGELADAYVEAYVGTPQEHDPFYSRERFIERSTATHRHLGSSS